jgi:hypothetical protein
VKALRAILCFYVVVWFNLVVPGHTRGIVSLPATCEFKQSTSCCAAEKSQPSKNQPTPLQKKNCAVCYVAATYTAVAWFTIDLAPFGDVIALHRDVAAPVPTVEFPLTHYATGPPARG